MDLVEIRKKANNKKHKPAEKNKQKAEATVELQQDQVLPEDEVREESIQAEEPDSPPPQKLSTDDSTNRSTAESIETSEKVSGKDPLDELFSFQVEGGLATEEAYLQALADEDEVVDTDIQQWLTFSLADEEYALTIESVSEIIKPREVTDIPRVPDFIKGIISLRGIIVPVFDLNCRLNLDAADFSASTRIIVCQDNERLAGFLVDRINQVVNVPLINIEPPPTVLSGLDRDFVEGVGRIDGRMLILLHLSNVINAELTD